jgi:hypothetical protein
MLASARSLLISSAALLAVAAAPAAAGADDQPPPCPRVSGELVRSFQGDLFVRDGSLWGCAGQYGPQPVTRRLGKWGKGSQAAFDGRYATWTDRSGKRDRISSVDVATGAVRFRDVAPVPGDSRDAKVAALEAYALGAAWVTTRGTLVMSVQTPTRAPRALGAGSAAAGGLALPLKPTADNRLVVGSWPGEAAAVARTLTLDATATAGSPCGASSAPIATVKPLADAARVGARWGAVMRNNPGLPGCERG